MPPEVELALEVRELTEKKVHLRDINDSVGLEEVASDNSALASDDSHGDDSDLVIEKLGHSHFSQDENRSETPSNQTTKIKVIHFYFYFRPQFSPMKHPFDLVFDSSEPTRVWLWNEFN